MNPEALAWIIKRLEPRMRELGKTFSWDRVNQDILMGSDLAKLSIADSTPEEIDEAIAKFAESCSPYLSGGAYEQNLQDINSWVGESNANHQAQMRENVSGKQVLTPTPKNKVL